MQTDTHTQSWQILCIGLLTSIPPCCNETGRKTEKNTYPKGWLNLVFWLQIRSHPLAEGLWELKAESIFIFLLFFWLPKTRKSEVVFFLMFQCPPARSCAPRDGCIKDRGAAASWVLAPDYQVTVVGNSFPGFQLSRSSGRGDGILTPASQIRSSTDGLERDSLSGLLLSGSQIGFWSPSPEPSALPWFYKHLIH